MPERSGQTPSTSETWHACCVAYNGRGLLIYGPSGSGKSSLALNLMAFGAQLVADDRVILSADDQGLRAEAPETLKGLIEARGFGILKSEYLPYVYIDACVNMQKNETQRLPDFRTIEICGHQIPCYNNSESPAFAAALLQFLKAGRHA